MNGYGPVAITLGGPERLWDVDTLLLPRVQWLADEPLVIKRARHHLKQ